MAGQTADRAGKTVLLVVNSVKLHLTAFKDQRSGNSVQRQLAKLEKISRVHCHRETCQRSTWERPK